MSPSGIRALIRMAADTDARGVLSAIGVPTLVIHRQGDLMNRRPVALDTSPSAFSGAKYRRAAGHRSFPMGWATPEAILGEVEEFLTGVCVRGRSPTACSPP